MQATLISTKQFDVQITALLRRDELGEFAIASRPDGNPVIPRTDGVRKARWSRQGLGKRGGLRIIYYYSEHHGVALLMAAYAKNVQENLTDDQKKQIRSLVARFRERLGA